MNGLKQGSFVMISFIFMILLNIPIKAMDEQNRSVNIDSTIEFFLGKHFESDPINKNYVCKHCSLIQDSQTDCLIDLQKHGIYQCGICSDIFCKAERLNDHIRRFDMKKQGDGAHTLLYQMYQYGCKCGMRFLLKSGLNHHDSRTFCSQEGQIPNPKKTQKKRRYL